MRIAKSDLLYTFFGVEAKSIACVAEKVSSTISPVDHVVQLCPCIKHFTVLTSKVKPYQ